MLAVFTTVASREEALTLATVLVERRLAACAQIEPIESVYRWDGAVRHEGEFRIVFKTVEALRKLPGKPKPEDGKPFRAAILAAARLDDGNRRSVVQLLQHWTNGKEFGAEKTELGRRFLQQIKDEVKKRAFPIPYEKTILTYASLHNDAGFIGAAGCAKLKFK